MTTTAECKQCWLKAVQCHSFYRYRTAVSYPCELVALGYSHSVRAECKQLGSYYG